jgi:hypothetical protein
MMNTPRGVWGFCVPKIRLVRGEKGGSPMSRTYHHGERRIRVRGVRRPTDLRRLARALIELEYQQAQAEAEAEAEHEQAQRKPAKRPKDRGKS